LYEKYENGGYNMSGNMNGGGEPGAEEPEGEEPGEEEPGSGGDDDNTEPVFHDILDCCGESCAHVIPMLQQQLEGMMHLRVLKLMTDDPDTKTAVPDWCANHHQHHQMLIEILNEESENPILNHYIMKM